jgi:hypothetical protein
MLGKLVVFNLLLFLLPGFVTPRVRETSGPISPNKPGSSSRKWLESLVSPVSQGRPWAVRYNAAALWSDGR